MVALSLGKSPEKKECCYCWKISAENGCRELLSARAAYLTKHRDFFSALIAPRCKDCSLAKGCSPAGFGLHCTGHNCTMRSLYNMISTSL